jgi:hypothetical protein
VAFPAEINGSAVSTSHRKFRAKIPEDSTEFLINASSSHRFLVDTTFGALL